MDNKIVSHNFIVSIDIDSVKSCVGTKVRDAIIDKIDDKLYTYSIFHNNIYIPVTIKWNLSVVDDSEIYFVGINLPYIDSVILNHTKMLIDEIVIDVRNENPTLGSEWSVFFCMSKPLS
mgnify:CR=1 FL=1